MKLNVIILAALIFAISCVSNDKEKETTVSSVPPAQPESGIKDTALYMRVGDPDTAMAFFVFKECYDYDYNLQREEYIRWDLEHDKLEPLVERLFQKRSDYNKRIAQISDNRAKFLVNARKVVVSDAHEHYVISDMMEFAYLVDRKDSILKDLIQEMLNNPKVETEEKKSLEAALGKL